MNAETDEEKKMITDFDAYTKTHVGEGKGKLPHAECMRDPNKASRFLNIVMPDNLCADTIDGDDAVVEHR